jgi:hypothetical protein
LETGSLTPLERAKLTPNQLRIWDARFGEVPAVPLREVAKRLGRPEGTVMRDYTLSREALERKPEVPGTLRSLECRDPEKAVEAIVELSSPVPQTIEQIALEVGIPAPTATALAKRLNGRYLPLKRALGETTKGELRDLAYERAYAIGASLDDEKIAKMPGYQAAIAFCALTDKGLLLDGQPTEQISVKELRGLDELMALMIAEAKRRGLRADADPETQQVLLTEGEMADGTPDMGRRKAP